MTDEMIKNEQNIEENKTEYVEERVIVFEEALEAILFAAGHPVTYATLGRVFDMTPSVVKDKVFEYSIIYNDPTIPRGVILLTYNDSCQLCTKETYLPEIRDALGIKKSGSLSSSSLEVLAIIAYNQPVTRAFVDTLRRVDSSYAMNNLLDRGLIVSKGRLDVPGRPMLYGTTADFLRCFGLPDLDSLPKTSDELISAFNTAKLSTNLDNVKAEEADEVDSAQIAVDIESAMPSAADDETGAELPTEVAAENTEEEIDTSVENDIDFD